MKSVGVFTFAAISLLAVAAWAAVPQLINFQGVLKDGSGNPVANGSYSVTFGIYEVPAGGTLLWAETTSVSTTDGLFSVLLGSLNPVPDSVFKGADRYLGTAVSPDGEVSPRQRLVSVGYAYRVNSVDGATGGTIFGNTSIQSDLSVAGTVDATGMSSKIRFHYDLLGDLPSPSTYHGMFAHVHTTEKAYFAHAGAWVPLANELHNHSSLSASDGFPDPALSVDADGNVGIGTTSPTKKLDVVGSAKVSDTLFASNVSSNSPLSLQAPAGTTRMYIDDATGNVGIGTTSPTEKLDVAGIGGIHMIARTTSSGNVAGVGIANPERRWFLQVRGELGNAFVIRDAGASEHRLLIDTLGNVGIGTTSPTKKLEVAGSIKVGVNDTVFASNVSSNSPLNLQAPAGSTRMYIDDATGNVGIGTTSPSSKLHVASPGNVDAEVENTAGVGHAQITTMSGAILMGLFAQTASGSGGIGTNSNHPIYFRTNLIERMRITEAGNVGIGTVSPAELLQVAKNQNGRTRVLVSNTTNGTESAAQFVMDGAGGRGGIYVTAPGFTPSGPLLGDQLAIQSESGLSNGMLLRTETTAAMRFATNNVTRVTIDGSSGNVGIGTANPGASNLLELSSTTKGFVLPRMTKTERDAIASPVAGMMVYQTDNTPGLRVYNGTNWMRFTETAD